MSRQVVEAAQVADPHFQVRDYSRRNRNFKVIHPDGSGILVKQAGSMEDPSFRESLEAEGALLEAVWTDETLADLRWFAPRFVDYDPARLVLATELIHPATSITKYHYNRRSIQFPHDAALSCARILAAFHRAGGQAIEAGRLPFVPSRHPFAWDYFTEKPRGKSTREPGSVLWSLIEERAPFWSRIPELKERWKSERGLVHRDVRWDNLLLTHGSGPRGALNVRLIDWEMASVGDPAWDVACYLSEYQRFWLTLLRSSRAEETVLDVDASQGYAPAVAHASVRTFLEAYVRSARYRAKERKALMERVREYLPFTMIILAVELMQGLDHFPAKSRLAVDFATQAASSPAPFFRSWYGLEA